MEQSSPSFPGEADGQHENQEVATASLFDVLTSRSRSLTEKELWAMCRECCLTLEYVRDCHDLFQSLCISPDSVAFDLDGNICFLDLDIEPETKFVDPKQDQCDKKSYRNHLYSLGMTLLFAIENKTTSTNHNAQFSEPFIDLLTNLTSEEIERRPDLDIVINACDKALAGESSQEICSRIVDLADDDSPQLKDLSDENRIGSLREAGATLRILSEINLSDATVNCLENTKAIFSVTSTERKERETTSQDTQKSRSSLIHGGIDKPSTRQIMLLGELIRSLNRSLTECELWSVCRECVLSLQRKGKHFPAYISLDTVAISDSGTICFKTIPETKPLDAIYAAPEFQQKCVLNDKTCLYGLGTVLRNAIDLNSSNSKLDPSSEALEILITSFTYENPDERPDLDTAFEMCEEYEKVSHTNSQQVCLQMFEEAMITHISLNNSRSRFLTEELHCPSTDANAIKPNDYVNEVASNKIFDSSPSLPLTAQKSNRVSDLNGHEPRETQTLSAFQNVHRPKSRTSIKRLPSAYSSPATHFKPIVLHNAQTEPTVPNQGIFSKEKVHHDLHSVDTNKQPNKITEPSNMNSAGSEKASVKLVNKTLSSVKSPEKVTLDLSQTLHQLQSQGHLTDTNIIASALAHYLTGCLTNTSSNERFNSAGHCKGLFNSTSVINSDVSDNSTQTFTPQFSSQTQSVSQPSRLPQQAINHNLHAPQYRDMPSTTFEVPHVQSVMFSENHSRGGRTIQSAIPSTRVATVPLTRIHGTFSYPFSSSSTVSHDRQYPMQHSGLSPNVPVQYALVQDSSTGLMQMLPLPYVPISQTHSSNSFPVIQNYLPDGDENIPSKKLYRGGNDQMKSSHRDSHQHEISNLYPHKHSSWHQDCSNSNRSSINQQIRITEKLFNGYDESSRVNANFLNIEEADSISQPSNSPSKDSGISLNHQPKHLSPNENVMDIEHRSANNDINRIFAKIVKIIQQTFSEIEIFNAGTDDTTIAEYVMSLSTLTWDTFCNAVTEKYFNLSWSYKVLKALHKIIEGHKTLKIDGTIKLLPAKFSRANFKERESETNVNQNIELVNNDLNRLSSYNSINHQSERQNVSLSQLVANEEKSTNQHIQGSHRRQQTLDVHQQERCTRYELSDENTIDSHVKHQLSNRIYSDNHEAHHGPKQSKFDKQERYQIINKHEFGNQEEQYIYKQHKLNSQEKQKSSYIRTSQAKTPDLSHSTKSLQCSSESGRPQSEIIRQKRFGAETENPTDVGARLKKQQINKHLELDKRSLSLHNLHFTDVSAVVGRFDSMKDNSYHRRNSTVTTNHENTHIHSKDFQRNKSNNSDATNKSLSLQHSRDNAPANSFIQSTSPQTKNTSENSYKNYQQRYGAQFKADQTQATLCNKNNDYSSPPASVVSLSSSSLSNTSQEHAQHNHSIKKQNNAKSSNFQSSHETNNGSGLQASISPSLESNVSSVSKLQTYVQSDKEHGNPGHHTSPALQCNKLNSAQKQFKHKNIDLQKSHTIHSSESEYLDNKTSTKTRFPSESDKHNKITLSSYHKHHAQSNSPSVSAVSNDKRSSNCEMLAADTSVPAEMRKLAAEKPELYNERVSSGMFMSQDKTKAKNSTLADDCQNVQIKQVSETNPYTSKQFNYQNQQESHHSSAKENQYKTSNNFSPNRQNTLESFTKLAVTSVDYKNSLPEYIARESNEGKVNHANGRSYSAIFSRQTNQQQTSSEMLDFAGNNGVSNRSNKRTCDEFDQLPMINSVLLPYTKQSNIVYHSAMIQLSLTKEVDAFIHSIDEENKMAIEKLLASITQEIMVQRRQRKKTQVLYRKLSEQIASDKKGDQSVTEQTLRDMSDMTKKLSFLHLCQTHLQMLLAELHGLDVSLLYSLCLAEGNTQLNVEPTTRNPYLQFRSISTSGAEQMFVLQAGTPRGLMSYLYTSSALSNGYIHQFLFCFRYILTADQLLTFILEKCHSAQRGSQNDVNMKCIQQRSMDLLHFWIEGYYSIDFACNKGLLKKLYDFMIEQTKANVPGSENLYSLYVACRLGENAELRHMIDTDEDNIDEGTYYFYLDNPKRWDSFRSLLKRSKSDKSNKGSRGGFWKSKSNPKTSTGSEKASIQFSVSECTTHILAEQLTLIEQDQFKKCHPIHFLNTQFQGVGVALSMPGLRTPSMSRKLESTQSSKRGLFVSEPTIESYVVHMINHSQELAHWVSAEILSCGSNKTQINVITKFLTAANMCHQLRNYATAFSILDGVENIVVRQLPVWKNIPTKFVAFIEDLTNVKMKAKSEALWLMSEKDCHIYPTIPCALYIALHIQQVEIGSFTLASGMYKWDKMRTISEIVDQLRIFRNHDYAFQPDFELQRSIRRCLNEYSEKDLHSVASTQNNNFHRHASSSSLSETFKKVKNMLHKKN